MTHWRAMACVLGDTDLLRPLGLGGIPCAVAAPHGSPSRYSRFARLVLDWADAWEHPAALLNLLERFGAAQTEPRCCSTRKIAISCSSRSTANSTTPVRWSTRSDTAQ